MEALSLFLLKSIVVSGLLTCWYFVGLRGRRLHQYNRFLLLTTLLASITIPFLHIQLFSIPHVATGGLAPVALFIKSAGNHGSPHVASLSVQGPFNWQALFYAIVVGISLTLLGVLLARILKVYSMCRQYPATQTAGVNLLLTDSAKAPFTFLNYLFWNRSIPIDGEIGHLIFRHELTHIEQGHTYDKLACQVLTCLFWFNPFYWIIQKELNIVHEFIADEQAVDNRDTETFAMMLLQSYSNGSYLVPEHYFFSSEVKRRLLMLQHVAKPSYASLRRFMVLPLMASTVLLFSFGMRNNMADNIVAAQKKIVVVLDPGHGGRDAGEQAGGYTEKEICLKTARRIKELAPAYNVVVLLTRDNDRDMQLADRTAISDKVKPDVYIALHVGDEAGKEKGKGDFDIYVSGDGNEVLKNNNFSSAIFQAMAQNGIIPGIAKGCIHNPNNPCASCRNAAMQLAMQQEASSEILSKEKEGLYVLNHAQGPAMILVLGNINNKVGMQQLTDDSRLTVLCNAVLKGIVEGASENASPAPDAMQHILVDKSGSIWTANNKGKENAGGCAPDPVQASAASTSRNN